MADVVIRGIDPKQIDLTVHAKYEVMVLPEGHGRLVDADAFKAMCLSATKEAKPDFIRHEDWIKSCAVTLSFCRDIDDQPTIVPAKGGDTDG